MANLDCQLVVPKKKELQLRRIYLHLISLWVFLEGTNNIVNVMRNLL